MVVKLIKYSDGKKIEINENEEFLEVLRNLEGGSECLEECLSDVVYIYEHKGVYTLYFTDAIHWNADGYIVESTSLDELFNYYAEKKGNMELAGDLMDSYKAIFNV